MARDYQRQAVYDTEARGSDIAVDRACPTIDIDGAQELLDLLAAEFEIRPVEAKANTRLKATGGWYMQHPDPTIEFPNPRRIHVSTVLHEFAHHLHDMTDREGASHGGRFTEAHIAATRAYLGDETADYMVKCYQQTGVDIGAEAEDGRREKVAATKPDDDAQRTRFAVRFVNDKGGHRWFDGKNGATTVDAYAASWARRRTAEKHAAAARDRLVAQYTKYGRTNWLSPYVEVVVVTVDERAWRGRWYIDRVEPDAVSVYVV